MRVDTPETTWSVPLATWITPAEEMGLAPVEVFEVAGFYHHFDLLGDGTEPAVLTVRVCDSLSCSLSG